MSQTLGKQFEDFARKQPATWRYDYCDAENCACAQFCRSIGVDYGTNRRSVMINSGLELVAMSGIHDWGELTKRLERFNSGHYDYELFDLIDA